MPAGVRRVSYGSAASKLPTPSYTANPKGKRGSQVRDIPFQTAREDVPGWFPGNYIEWLAYEAVNKNGLKFENDPRPEWVGNDAIFQDPQLGGRLYAGGSIVDMVITSEYPPLALPVQGEYWHPAFGPKLQEDLLLFRRLIVERGFDVIPLDESNLLENAFYTVQQAIKFRNNLSRYKYYL